MFKSKINPMALKLVLIHRKPTLKKFKVQSTTTPYLEKLAQNIQNWVLIKLRFYYI